MNKKYKLTKEKHGMRNTRFYAIWCGMKSRCLNKNNKDYKNYGAKDICITKKWLLFSVFMKDMLLSYVFHLEKYGKQNTTIERMNNNGGYNKKNCTWATKKEQANNKTYGWKKLKRGKDGKFHKAQELKDKADELLEEAEKLEVL